MDFNRLNPFLSVVVGLPIDRIRGEAHERSSNRSGRQHFMKEVPPVHDTEPVEEIFSL